MSTAAPVRTGAAARPRMNGAASPRTGAAASERAAALWRRHDAAWRDPAQVVANCEHASPVARELLRGETRGDWWSVLERLDACLVVSREYEHLLLALAVTPAGPRRSYMALPHPSGLAFDASAGLLHVASTRNPNQLYTLAPVDGAENGCHTDTVAGERPLAPGHGAENGGSPDAVAGERPLVPLSVTFLPGRLRLHDLAFVGGALHGAAAGLNAIVRFAAASSPKVVWWPRSIERNGQPDLTSNYLQLNSIAAGESLESSFFTASAETPSARRPGHRNFPVDRRGVIFSGDTREPVARGLTRPHSARLHGGELWVDDSGYGAVGVARDGRVEPVTHLPGWTRGLTFSGDVAFVGTSRVIPRYAQYAPGLEVERSVCGVHALDTRSGTVLGSIVWPAGNQIFEIAVLPRATTLGFPATAGRTQRRRALESFFYSYRIPDPQEPNDH
jgi:uncharacterized protein (TIGR03032 family)